MIQARNYKALGLEQSTKYWKFLFFASADIMQEIELANLEYPAQEDIKKFSLALNRRLYHLARDLGFRKRHMDEGRNDKGQWWERKIYGFDEVDPSADKRFLFG